MNEKTLSVADGVGGSGFVQIPREQLGELTPQAFALHAALLSYGWRDECWPSMETLSQKTRMGEKALRAAKVELVQAGLLDETRRGQGKPNVYVVRTWDQRRESSQSGKSRSSQTKVLDPPAGRHEVEVGEVEVEESLRSSSTAVTAGGEDQGKPKTPGHAFAGFLTGRLVELMLVNDPKAKIPKADSASYKRWLDSARLLIDADGRDPDETMRVLEFCQRDEFWKGNVLSMPKFREKYPTLRARWLVHGRAKVVNEPGFMQQSASSAELARAYGLSDRERRAGIR